MVGNSKTVVHPDDGCCGVSEPQFPCTGKCCETRDGDVRMEYSGLCSYCSILKLPIDSSSLEAVSFFECTRYGYVRRVKGSELSR